MPVLCILYYQAPPKYSHNITASCEQQLITKYLSYFTAVTHCKDMLFGIFSAQQYEFHALHLSAEEVIMYRNWHGVVLNKASYGNKVS